MKIAKNRVDFYGLYKLLERDECTQIQRSLRKCTRIR
jgi:hypothetical protein